MATKGNIFCTIERLYDREGKGSINASAGITLSASWEDKPEIYRGNFLFPWRWLATSSGPEYLTFRVWAAREKDRLISSVMPLTVRPATVSQGGRTIAQIRQNTGGYSGLTETLAIRFPSLAVSYVSNPLINVDTATSTPYGAKTPWPGILADLATRPAPIPQVLLLSFILPNIPMASLIPNGEKPEDWRMFAAPVIPQGVLDNAKSTDLTAKAVLQDDRTTVFWDYLQDGYQAQCESVRLGDSIPGHSFFDMSTRLVTAPMNETWHSDEDWQTSLESRLGDALDLGGELLLRIGDLSPGADARVLADAAIAALRDVAGIGVNPAPSGRALFGKLADDNRTAINAATRQAFGTVAQWKLFLDGQLSKLDANFNKLPALQAGKLLRDDAISQLHAIRQKLLVPDTLWTLLQNQISTIQIPQDLRQQLLSVPKPADPKTLPPALRAENLGRFWTTITQSLRKKNGVDYTPDNLRDSLATALRDIAEARFSNGPRTDDLPVIAAGFADVQAALHGSKSWSIFAGRVIPAAPDKSQNTGTGLASQGITIQVNEFDDPRAQVQGEVALVKKLQGISMLLTPAAGNKEWTCLNYADVYYRHEYQVGNTIRKELKPLEKRLIVSNRFSYQNEVALATITYNNEPLPAAGPLARAARLVDPPPGNSYNGIEVDNDLLVYRYAAAPLTPLVHGKDYLPQPFLMSASGAVPAGLALANDQPFELKSDLSTVAGLGNTWKTVEYRRLCAPGQLRLSDVDSNRNLKFPPIPDGVFPITPRVADSKASRPLLLLVPPDPTFTGPVSFMFAVRPPSTDVLTWDRFANRSDSGLGDRREGVIKEVLNTARTNIANAKSGTPAQNRSNNNNLPDVTIDDPAAVRLPVGGHAADYDCRFKVELLRENGQQVKWPSAAGAPEDYGVVKFPVPSADTGLPGVQTRPFRVVVQAVPSGNLSLSPPSGGIITINVPRGTRATLRLSVCIPGEYESRFRGVSFGSKAASGYFEINPTEMGIEVATAQLPDPKDLFDKLQVLPFSVLDGSATVNLNLAGVQNQEYVQSAEVLRQVWKWQGRLMKPALPDQTGKAEWLLRQFGSRADSDYLRATMQPKSGGGFSYVEDLSSLVSPDYRATAQLPPSPNSRVATGASLRGTYIRFGIQVESRYKPLIRIPSLPLNANIAAAVTPGVVRGIKDKKLWQDLYVPSRKISSINPPDIKLALALTRNPNRPDTGPGILVLLRGPWFQDCGLGETLEARLTMVEDPADAPNTQKRTFYFQFGPDPLLKKPADFRLTTRDSSVDEGWQQGTITGPVGHSFDTVSSDQLFINTSFILNYPAVKEIAARDWSFCQLQVRRAVFNLNEKGDSVRAGHSEWTQPMWVQLLPDFDLYSDTKAGRKYSDLRLLPDSQGAFILTDAAGNPAPPPQAGTGDSMFQQILAVTHFVADVTGVPTQESFDSLCLYSNGKWQPVDDKGLTPLNQRISAANVFRGRLLTVQGRPVGGKPPTLKTEDAIWDALFKPTVPDVERLRIVGVSRPIDMKNSPYPGC